MIPFHNTSNNPSVWPVRVYYEDTDAGGVVYYANYLRFCERARTEKLRAGGIDHRRLEAEHGIVLVVRHVDADYLGGARLDDLLHVTTRITDMGAASIRFEQQISRGEELLFKSVVTIACLDARRWRATRIPPFLRTLLEREA